MIDDIIYAPIKRTSTAQQQKCDRYGYMNWNYYDNDNREVYSGLALGGPVDGQLHVCRCPSLYIPEFPPLAFFDNSPPDKPPVFRRHAYVYERLWGDEEIFGFWKFTELTYDEMLERLIERASDASTEGKRENITNDSYYGIAIGGPVEGRMYSNYTTVLCAGEPNHVIYQTHPADKPHLLPYSVYTYEPLRGDEEIFGFWKHESLSFDQMLERLIERATY